MAPTWFFLFGVAISTTLLATLVVPPADRAFTRLCLASFRDIVERPSHDPTGRRRLLGSVRSTATYPVFASKTVGYALLVGAIGGSLVAGATGGSLGGLESIGRQAPRGASPPVSVVRTLLDVAIPLGIPTLAAATTATVTYHGRWWLLRLRAERRRRRIDESLTRTVAFMYALSRGGMNLSRVMQVVALNRESFGETAEEVRTVVRDADGLGTDLATALERAATRTPSDRFAEFAGNVANVLGTGGAASAYLRDQYERYHEERRVEQAQVIERLGALGEAYVAGLVAAPLFAITILLVFGVLTGRLLGPLGLVVYFGLPVGTLAFLGYVHVVAGWSGTESMARIRPGRQDPTGSGVPATTGSRPAGGSRPAASRRNRACLAGYERLRPIRRFVDDPLGSVLGRPRLVSAVVVPAVAAVAGVRLWLLARGGPLTPRAVQPVIVESAILIVAPVAVVSGARLRRTRRIDRTLPDLLARLAAANEAGTTFTGSLRRVAGDDKGPLDEAVSRLVADVGWGARTERALERFADRVPSRSVERAVALLSNAMGASGDLAPVLRIAADRARRGSRLRARRHRAMFAYVLVVYLAFAVFLGIGAALELVLLPTLPDPGHLSGRVPGAAVPADPGANPGVAAYRRVLHHAAFIQAVCSGLVAGKLGEGWARRGAKHVAAMLLVAYGVSIALGW